MADKTKVHLEKRWLLLVKTEATKIELKTGDFLNRVGNKYDIDGA